MTLDCDNHDLGADTYDFGKVISNKDSSSSAWQADPELDIIADEHDTRDGYQSRDPPPLTRRQHVSPIARFLSASTSKSFSANNTRPPSSADQTTKFSSSMGDNAVSCMSQSPQFDFTPGGGIDQGFFWSSLQQMPASHTHRAIVSRVNTSESIASECLSTDELGPLESALSSGMHTKFL